jgi:hypothetical protein
MLAEYPFRQAITQRAERGPMAYEKGRVCAAPDCRVVLSRYNEDPYCWNHRHLGDRPNVVQKRQKEQS